MTLEITPELRSKSDPGWILRAGRILAQGCVPPAEGRTLADLRHAAQDQSAAAAALPPEVVRREIESIIMAEAPGAGLQWLHEAGVLPLWLPELSATVDFSQEAGRRHKDVWEHTKQVVLQAELRPAVRWAALLHDIGKVPTRTFTTDGKVHFHRHSEVGARMFEDIGRRLGFDRPIHKTLRFLILHHLRANQYVESWTDAAVRRFDREMDHHLQDLLDLSRADITSRRPGKRQQALESIDRLEGRMRTLRAEDAVLPLLPSGIGNAIMERFKLPPSRMIGDLKRQLETAVEAGTLEARREPDYYLPEVERLLAELPGAPCICRE
jgi:poly(A) polymerase